MSNMNTRRILVAISALGVAATLVAVLQGAWLFALAIYAMCVIGLTLLLRQAVRQQRRQGDPARRTTLHQAAEGTAVPPAVTIPRS